MEAFADTMLEHLRQDYPAWFDGLSSETIKLSDMLAKSLMHKLTDIGDTPAHAALAVRLTLLPLLRMIIGTDTFDEQEYSKVEKRLIVRLSKAKRSIIIDGDDETATPTTTFTREEYVCFSQRAELLGLPVKNKLLTIYSVAHAPVEPRTEYISCSGPFLND